MMIRSTTNGVLKSYRYNLQRSSYTLNKAMNTVLTGRNFDTYAADPATAAALLPDAPLFSACQQPILRE